MTNKTTEAIAEVLVRFNERISSIEERISLIEEALIERSKGEVTVQAIERYRQENTKLLEEMMRNIGDVVDRMEALEQRLSVNVSPNPSKR
jgi:hypothetical protein